MTSSIPWSQLSGTSEIYLKYLSDPLWRKKYLGYEMKSLDDVELVAKSKRQLDYDRVKLHALIKKYMDGLGVKSASSKIQVNLDKILNPEACFIITGQQPALAGGPLYNYYKAQSVISVAQALEEKTGKPFIPLFWIGSNDHDVDEANRNYYLDDNKRLRKMSFYFKENIPLHLLKVGRKYQENISFLKGTLGRQDYFNETKKMLEPKDSDHFGEWQSRILLNMFSEEGLLVVEPKDLVAVSQNAFKNLLENESEIIAAVDVQNQLLEKEGLTTQVTNDVTSRFMIYMNSNDRVRLTRKNDHWSDGTKSYELNELLELNNSKKIELTPDALGRPLWQDLILPTAAYIGGPGEISYFHQLKKAYQKLNVKMPVVLPRISATILEPSQIKFLKKNKISIDEFTLLSDWENVPLSEPFPDQDISILLKSWSEHAKFSAGQDELKKFHKKMIEINNRFYRTMENIRLREDGIGNKQLDEFKDFIFPLNGLQERSIGLMQVMSKHGQSIIDEIKHLKYEFGCHQLIVIG